MSRNTSVTDDDFSDNHNDHVNVISDDGGKTKEIFDDARSFDKLDKYNSEHFENAMKITDTDFDGIDDDGKKRLISKRFARNKRCCWGGMARLPFYCFLSLAITSVFLAIFVPLILYVFMPLISQHIVDHTELGIADMTATSWSYDEGSVEEEQYNIYLPLFAKHCHNESLLDKETFLNTRVKDTLPCFFAGSTENADTAIFNMLLSTYLRKTGAMTFRDYFASIDMTSCSYYNPRTVLGTMDITLDGIPGFLHGSISESYLYLYDKNDDIETMEPFGRIAIPGFSINEKIPGTDIRIAKGIKGNIKVYDRIRFLLATFHLLDFDPITSGYAWWRQIGDLMITVDMGASFHMPVKLDTLTRIGPAKFTVGPFSQYNPDAKVDVESPYSFFGCIILDFLPHLVETGSEHGSEMARDMYRRSLGECNVDFDQDLDKQAQEVHACLQILLAPMKQKLSNNMENMVKTSKSTSGSVTALSELIERFPNALDNLISTKNIDNFFGTFFDNDDAEEVPNFVLDHYDALRVRRADDTTHAYTHCDNDFDTNKCSFAEMKTPHTIQPNHPEYEEKCLFGDDYHFSVHPGTGENRSKVLLYWQGGGADWEELMNDFTSTCTTTANDPKFNGVYDKTNPANPFRTWTIITVLYCSGDAHNGKNIQVPANETVIPDGIWNLLDFTTNVTLNPHKVVPGLAQERIRHGFDNTMSVLKWIEKQPEIANPEHLVMMGCSAGALGAQIWSAKARDFLKVPADKSLLMPDSYVGVFPSSSMLDFESGEFQLLEEEEINQDGPLSRTVGYNCYNVSTDYKKEQVLSSPVGKVIKHDWDMCTILREEFHDYVSNYTLDSCDNNLFDIHTFFDEQFKHFGSTVAWINSKADSVQRIFPAFVKFTVANHAGIQTTNNPTIQKTTSLDFQGCEVELDNNSYTFCAKLDSCIENHGIFETNTYWNNISLTNRDSLLDLYLTQFLIDVDNSTKFQTPLNTFTNKLFASLDDYLMGGGNEGHRLYWESADKMINDYSNSEEKKTWFFVDSTQHCYTDRNEMYTQTAKSGQKMCDWMQENVNYLLNGNSGRATRTCDDTDGEVCPKGTEKSSPINNANSLSQIMLVLLISTALHRVM